MCRSSIIEKCFKMNAPVRAKPEFKGSIAQLYSCTKRIHQCHAILYDMSWADTFNWSNIFTKDIEGSSPVSRTKLYDCVQMQHRQESWDCGRHQIKIRQEEYIWSAWNSPMLSCATIYRKESQTWMMKTCYCLESQPSWIHSSACM